MSDAFMPSGPSVHTVEHHAYDLLENHKNPFLMRMNDPAHQNINIGDMLHVQGHNSIMDRQKFTVVGRTEHPSFESALAGIEHSSLSARDKIQMTDSFREVHASQVQGGHSFVALHLAPHGGV